MNFKEFIESLGKALGMRLENAGGACALDVDGVTVMLHDADDLVLLAAEIGPPPPEDGLEAAQIFRDKCKYIIHKYPVGLQAQVRKRLFTDPGFSEDKDGVITLDATKFKAGELHYAALRAIGMNGAALPKYIDEDLYRELTSLRTGERREAYLADLAKRLPPDAVDSARKRLDQAIDYAIKLAAEYKVVKNGDFEKREVQKSLLEPEIAAGNVVKPVGNFQLKMEPRPKNKDQARRQVVRRANIQAKSIFMRDIYGRVTNAEWLG